MLRLISELVPALHAGIERIAAARGRMPRRALSTAAGGAIDTAVMEKVAKLATLPLDCGWSDLGSWAALAEVRPRTDLGNAGGRRRGRGRCCRQPAPTPSAVRWRARREAGRGAHADTVLVAARASAEVRLLTELEGRGRTELTTWRAPVHPSDRADCRGEVSLPAPGRARRSRPDHRERRRLDDLGARPVRRRLHRVAALRLQAAQRSRAAPLAQPASQRAALLLFNGGTGRDRGARDSARSRSCPRGLTG